MMKQNDLLSTQETLQDLLESKEWFGKALEKIDQEATEEMEWIWTGTSYLSIEECLRTNCYEFLTDEELDELKKEDYEVFQKHSDEEESFEKFCEKWMEEVLCEFLFDLDMTRSYIEEQLDEIEMELSSIRRDIA